eukprot:TRINITY_DN10643_c0_g1_i1.p3 TRINITY_DN10643_c0_g1~~TRINITY_DN10643_c0_g1_i1.p3  ORF type:complete len:54 (-),score=2.74 TRINITY_DN10643_c0_g1_i1:50-211(-)
MKNGYIHENEYIGPKQQKIPNIPCAQSLPPLAQAKAQLAQKPMTITIYKGIKT